MDSPFSLLFSSFSFLFPSLAFLLLPSGRYAVMRDGLWLILSSIPRHMDWEENGIAGKNMLWR